MTRGLIDSLWIHRKMMLNPRYGIVGLLGFPYFVFLEVLAPIVELSGYIIIPLSYAFGVLDLTFFALFLTVAILLGAILSTSSVVLEELSFRRYPKTSDLLKLISVGLLENIGYRQLSSWWRLMGTLDYLRGQTTWGRMERKGFAKT